MRSLAIFVCLLNYLTYVWGSCAELNNCSGHGRCGLNSQCVCYEGWGAPTDLTSYRAADCSAKVCPSGTSWGDLRLADGEAHRLAECSDKGICQRDTGKCLCSKGFEGAACQRSVCPNKCSGHGRCMTMERMAMSNVAFPLSKVTTYQSSNVSFADSYAIIFHMASLQCFFFFWYIYSKNANNSNHICRAPKHGTRWWS